MGDIIWQARPPDLRAPILVCAFSGWNDAGSAATTALQTVARSLGARTVAHVDPEEFFDFQVTRPTITLASGQTRRVDWPENRLLAAPVEGADRDLLLLDGIEPNMRWRSFTEQLADAAEQLGAEMIVSMGALIADVVHTLPVPITGIGSEPELVQRLGLERSNYEGPTGVVGVLHDTCRRLGMTSASLWAAVPHYVSAVPNPRAALALVRKLEALTRVAIDASELEEESEQFERQVDQAVEANPEIASLVQRLEAEQREEVEPAGEMPSAESIAREFQTFLRQQGEER